MKSVVKSVASLQVSLLFALLIVVVSACEKPRKIITLPSGTKYLIYKTDEKARQVAEKDIATVHITLATPKDSVIGSTYQRGKPQMVSVSKEELTFLYEVFTKFRKGDSVAVWVKAELLVKDKAQRMKVFGTAEEVKYTIVVLDLKTREELEKGNSKQNEENEKLIQKQADTDDKILEEYVKKNSIKAEKTASGLYLLKTKTSEETQAKAGDTVRVHYTVKLLDGKVLESSLGKEPYEFILGNAMVIKGWDEGIALLKKGEKAMLLVPSRLAYGMAGNGPSIPPNSVLMFDVELFSIKGKK
jgi:FKBP-type peptidyl-prolyl cis-trans isomerase FkpA